MLYHLLLNWVLNSYSTGKFETITNNNNSVFSYQRYDSENAIIVVVNLSSSEQNTQFNYPDYDPKKKDARALIGNEIPLNFGNKFELELPPYGIEVFQLSKK